MNPKIATLLHALSFNQNQFEANAPKIQHTSPTEHMGVSCSCFLSTSRELLNHIRYSNLEYKTVLSNTEYGTPYGLFLPAFDLTIFFQNANSNDLDPPTNQELQLHQLINSISNLTDAFKMAHGIK